MAGRTTPHSCESRQPRPANSSETPTTRHDFGLVDHASMFLERRPGVNRVRLWTFVGLR